RACAPARRSSCQAGGREEPNVAEMRADGGWEDVLEQVELRRTLAREREDNDYVRRFRAQGRQLARERIEGLTDPGSFEEVGTAAGTPVYEDGRLTAFTPTSTIGGVGKVD